MLLSVKQIAAFDCVAKLLSEGKKLTLEIVAKELGLGSRYDAYRYIDILIQRGFLAKSEKSLQSVRVIKYPSNATVPVYDVKKDSPDYKPAQAAYARGVAAGKALTQDTIDAEALRRAFKKGYQKGRDSIPKNFAEAFDKGVEFGRLEARKERRLAERLTRQASSETMENIEASPTP